MPLGEVYNDDSGLDLAKLQDYIQVPTGQSIDGHIRIKYGNDAIALIYRLI
jgi:hypothetical protein